MPIPAPTRIPSPTATPPTVQNQPPAAPSEDSAPPATPAPVTRSSAGDDALSLEHIVRRWAGLMDTFGTPELRRIQALLRAAVPVGWNNGTITLSFKYPFHRDMIEDTRNRHVVERVLSEQLGQSVSVLCRLGGDDDD